MFNPQTGLFGSVTIGGNVFALGKWKASIKSALPKVNNFTSPYQQLVGGLLSAALTLDGPYDAGNMPLVAGTSYIFSLGVNGALSYIVTAFVESIDLSDDIEDAARVSISAQSSGAFSAAIS